VTSYTAVHALAKPDESDAIGLAAAQVSLLADRLEAILPRCGRSGPHAVAAVDTSYTAAVNFPDPFPVGVVPVVQVSAEVGAPTAIVTASGVSNTGFTLNYRRVQGTVSVSVCWTAQVTT
jgi:hypothetical protein